MRSFYNLGEFGTMTIAKNRESNLFYGFVSKEKEAYIFKGRNLLEFEGNMIETLKGNNELRLALRIKEKGLEKTSQDYQTLQSKKMEGGN